MAWCFLDGGWAVGRFLAALKVWSEDSALVLGLED
jgi:hypothetical protein